LTLNRKKTQTPSKTHSLLRARSFSIARLENEGGTLGLLVTTVEEGRLATVALK
jgi:hypothetical protein